MKIDKILVRNTLTGAEGSIRRDWYHNPAFNPQGLLEEIDVLTGGCVDCGVAPPEAEAEEIEPETKPAKSKQEPKEDEANR